VTYSLRDPEYLDLDFARGNSHWRFQRRDRKGMWTDEGGTAKNAVETLVSKSHSVTTSSHTTTSIDENTGKLTRKHREEMAKKVITTVLPKGSKHTQTKIETWHATKNEEDELWSHTPNDPLHGLSKAELAKHAHGSDPEMRQKALDSINARAKHTQFLAEVLNDGVRNAKTREALQAWDSKVEKIPGGKVALRMRDRLIGEKNLYRLHGAKEAIKEFGKESGLYIATGAVVFSLLGLTAQYIAMRHGGGADALEHAKHAVDAFFLHKGHIGGTAPGVSEAVTFTVATALVARLGKQAAKLFPHKRAKKHAPTHKA
jgi:hypothetical protein